ACAEKCPTKAIKGIKVNSTNKTMIN
ncbi:MAG: hypothetical protein K0R09_3046, partial [Clostridiales bacterium]|nr:hypothetical protein [Clostridiales bacterium]